jgi:hypothetical protein
MLLSSNAANVSWFREERMKFRLVRLLAPFSLAAVLLFQPAITNTVQATQPGIDDEMNDIQERLISGFAAMELGSKQNGSGSKPTSYFPRGSDSCPTNQSSNIKVNQNCLNLSDPDLQGRGQAQNEESIAADPNQPNHLIASYNDYRRGDGTCGVSYSLDKGRTWNETTVPNSFTRGINQPLNAPREYWQASGDTSVGWDSEGNAYLSCQVFKRGPATAGDPDRASGFYVFRSTQNNGASFNFPGRSVFDTGFQRSFLPLEDKQFMGIDNNPNKCAGSPATATPGSSCTPFQDRIYVTWSEFAPDGTAFIYESYSSDYGEHFSNRHLVSSSSALCVNDYGLAVGGCNENQFSQPFVGPDGVLYVIFSNFNNAATLGTTQDNRNQILLARSLDGGNTFTSLVKVSDYYDLPDCATYQQGHDLGRACVPEKNATANSIFRATNLGSGAVNPTNPNQVVVTFGSYINKHSNEANGCTPTSFSPVTGQNLFTGVKTVGACNNDILISVSNDGGQTFTGSTTDPRLLTSVNTEPGQATTDQWWQWIAFTKNGKLATSYYDRQYGDDELTGFSDFSLSGTGDVNGTSYGVQRVSSGSMPFPTQFPEGGGSAGGTFWGDYTGLTATDNAYPFWSDTRDPDLFVCTDSAGAVTLPPSVCGGQSLGTTLNDQNAYTAANSVPSR